MRAIATAAAVLSLLPSLAFAGNKLTLEDRIELTPRPDGRVRHRQGPPAPLQETARIRPKTGYDKNLWADIAKTNGPAARTGDLVQVTKVELEDDKIVLQINGGFKGGRKWYDNVQVGMGGATNPISQGSNAPGGTSIAILFHQPLESVKSAAIKKMLAPVIDFERHSVTEIYSETLSPEVQQAIKDKRVTEGMNREQVVMALGRPAHKSRETKDGIEEEDWVYGTPPGRIVFVTFNGDKVIKVKESYAGLGTQVADPPVVR